MKVFLTCLWIISFIIIPGMVFVSCGQSDSKQNGISGKTVELPYQVDLEANLLNINAVSLSEIGKTIEYVPLETNSSSMLERINQIEFCDSFIFISDFNRLLQFDREGRFIRQVGTNGRSHGGACRTVVDR